MNKTKILVIEDDQDFRESLGLLLENKYDVEMVESGLVGVKRALQTPPDLILMDLRMPDIDGLQACRMLRSDHELNHIPIIIVSGHNSTAERTQAFEAGADDFIAKPFDNGEIMARIHRKLDSSPGNSARGSQAEKILNCGNVRLDLGAREVSIHNRPVQLSSIEFKLLYLLVLHCDRIVSRETILEKVWDGEPVSARVIDPHIVALRTKMEGSDHMISSVYGKGYIFKLVG